MFDIDQLDELEPFEIDSQAAHLFKHAELGLADLKEMWMSDPVFYPASPPAHWLMVAQVGSRVLDAPLAPSRSGRTDQCRPIGCYPVSHELSIRYRRDR